MKLNEAGIPSFTFLSQRLLDMLDLDREKAMADANYVFASVHPEDFEGLIAISEMTWKNISPFYWEGRIVVRGETRWFVCESIPRKLSDGTVIWEGATTDITKQKLAELELIKKHYQTVELLNNTPFPMALNSTKHNKITFLNHSFTKLFGYDLNDISTVDEWAVLAYPDKDYREMVFSLWFKGINDYLTQGTAIPQSEVQIRTKFGDVLDVIASASVINDDVIISFLDITKSKKRTQALFDKQQEAIDLTLRQISHTEEKMLSSLIALANERDNETGNHIVRTQHYVKRIAVRLKEMGHYTEELSEEKISQLFKAAPLHDIGKVGIPDSILKKPASLNDEEWIMMKTHTTIGEKVLSAYEVQEFADADILRTAMLIAGGHHEKWDGSGYPRGLSEQKIPLPARIMSIADVYDALVNERVYKLTWTHDDAVKEILALRGIQFDPVIVDAFLLEIDAFKKISEEYRD